VGQSATCPRAVLRSRHTLDASVSACEKRQRLTRKLGARGRVRTERCQRGTRGAVVTMPKGKTGPAKRPKGQRARDGAHHVGNDVREVRGNAGCRIRRDRAPLGRHLDPPMDGQCGRRRKTFTSFPPYMLSLFCRCCCRRRCGGGGGGGSGLRLRKHAYFPPHPRPLTNSDEHFRRIPSVGSKAGKRGCC